MQYHNMTSFAAEHFCLLTYSIKELLISTRIITTLRIKKYQHVIVYLRMVEYQFASITESRLFLLNWICV